jgi:hypothetical protein
MYTTHTKISERKQITNFNVKNTVSENPPPEVFMLLSIMKWFSGI